MGLRCTTTAETDSIKQYVYSLSGLAVLNIMLKVVWVVDVILLAKKSLRQTDQDGDDDGGQDDGRNGKGGGQYVDDPDGEEDENPMSNSSFMIYFSIQARSVIHLICHDIRVFACFISYVYHEYRQ